MIWTLRTLGHPPLADGFIIAEQIAKHDLENGCDEPVCGPHSTQIHRELRASCRPSMNTIDRGDFPLHTVRPPPPSLPPLSPPSPPSLFRYLRSFPSSSSLVPSSLFPRLAPSRWAALSLPTPSHPPPACLSLTLAHPLPLSIFSTTAHQCGSPSPARQHSSQLRRNSCAR